jgi:hypothetical protein
MEERSTEARLLGDAFVAPVNIFFFASISSDGVGFFTGELPPFCGDVPLNFCISEEGLSCLVSDEFEVEALSSVMLG